MFLAIEATVVEAVATNLREAFPPADCFMRICLRPPLRTRLVVLLEVGTNLRAAGLVGGGVADDGTTVEAGDDVFAETVLWLGLGAEVFGGVW